MAEVAVLIAKIAARPSVLWRLAWLVFCLLVLLLFGARTLQLITPSVIAGATGSSSKAVPSSSPNSQLGDFGPLATYILPSVAWLLIGAAGVVLVR
ncbi:hypothetical protein [Micromonospora aurantiaca (nom. illeg.)]|uniref:hypothetical protein n=1 Tax=Micromonospora aurantiaca (nom. illeg.) TaxID=47850 RepID=UPI000828E9CA|nr:hypothetical protein [Micromonospora aurantiaca]SCL40127.1 hypothetical protein GA0070615_4292 [Micromonospora aurantiaca]